LRYVEAGYPGEGASERRNALSNGALGMLVFVTTELMFFASLISAYLVISAGAVAWPPPDQPRLPVALTGFNSLILFASAYMMFRTYRSFGAEACGENTRRLMKATMLLGTCFVAIQGFEWIRLLSHGLTLTSSQYGAFFYLIIGTHALHAMGAIFGVWRAYRLLKAKELRGQTLMATQIFWYFVVGVWPALYVLVYWA